ncbi:MAG: PD-(D/E)XK nuclease family protein, partial [Lachnospiraceae bacterium]
LKPMDEVRKVAVEIQKIIQESNDNNSNGINNNCVRYKNIAVATGDLETYAPLFKRVFAEYGIPYFIDKTFPVLMNPFIEYIRAILDIITENFSYSSVFRYLRSPLNDYDTADIDNIENFVLKHGINGVTSWRADWSKKYVNEQAIAIEKIRQKVIDDLSIIVDLISDGTKKKRDLPTKVVNEINAVIIRLLETHNIENRLLFLYESYSTTDDIFKRDRQKEYEKIYSLVISLLERMSELLVDEKITFKEYGELLDAGFDEIRVGVIPTITDYIQIGDITRSRFDNIHTLFIVGANEGIIPKSSSSGGIISDIEKEFLIESTPDIELSPTVREQSFTGQLYLYMLMTKPTNRLHLSYSRISESGDSIRPSYIIKVIKDMFKDIEVERDFEDLKASVYSVPSLFNAIVENLREEQAKLLINTFINSKGANESLKNNLIKSVNAAFSAHLTGNDSISKAIASVLYGKSIIGSVTRLEQYAKCSFNYFLKYGLSLKEREIFSFEAKDMGTILHAVLEKYANKVNSHGIYFSDVSEGQREIFVREAINECLDDPSMSVLSSSFRHKYMLERIFRISMRSVKVLTEHITAGDFLIKGTEVSFKSEDNLSSITFRLSDDEIMKFSGKIDRLDTYEDDEHIYVKIIDYKSGDKNLNLIEIYRGLSLQLVVYMNAATELLNRNSNKEIVPAGILYYHIDDPIVEGLIDEDSDSIADKIKKQLKMKGLVNNDENVYSHIDKDFTKTSDIIPVIKNVDGTLSKKSSAIDSEQFDTISKYVNKKILSIGREILDGNIKAEPHSADSIDSKACSYCPYTDMCRYNGEKAEYSDGVNKENVFDMMKEVISFKEES